MASERVDSVAGSADDRYPIRGTFFGCCASVLAPYTMSATTIAKIPAHFGFWILRRSPAQVLDFRLRPLSSRLTPHHSRASPNHLIRALKYAVRNCQTDLFCRLKVYDGFKLRCLLDRKIGRFGALQDLVHINGSVSPQIHESSRRRT